MTNNNNSPSHSLLSHSYTTTTTTPTTSHHRHSQKTRRRRKHRDIIPAFSTSRFLVSDLCGIKTNACGREVLKSNESNVATCIGVCRCGRFDGKFHAIVRQYDDAQSVSRSNKKKKKRSYCFTYRTECVHFDSLISLSSTTTSSSSKMMCIAC